jgi:carbon-monoxide dehydrogenase medium subunit
VKRKVGDYAIAAAAAILSLDGGTCSQAAIALTNVGPKPLNASEAAAALVGTAVDDEAIAKAAALAAVITDPAADLRGPVDYRKHAAGVMTRRAIETALARAKGA